MPRGIIIGSSGITGRGSSGKTGRGLIGMPSGTGTVRGTVTGFSAGCGTCSWSNGVADLGKCC